MSADYAVVVSLYTALHYFAHPIVPCGQALILLRNNPWYIQSAKVGAAQHYLYAGSDLAFSSLAPANWGISLAAQRGINIVVDSPSPHKDPLIC